MWLGYRNTERKASIRGSEDIWGELLKDLAARKECKILEGNLVLDHVRILISIPPKYPVSQAVGFIHLFNLSTLGLDNDIGKLPDARVRDASTLAGQDGDGMMGNHGLHIRHILNGFLAANEPESGGKNDRTRYEYPYIHLPVDMPIQHESQHDDGHCRPIAIAMYTRVSLKNR